MPISHETRRDSLDTPSVSVRRYDVAEMGGLRPAAESPEGFLLLDVYIAKPGVLTYRDNAGNEWRELIEADELHNDASLETLVGKPVTLEHPDEDVDPDNADISKGAIGENITVMQDGRVRIVYMVQKRDAINAVKDGGKREASPGYRCDIQNSAGVHPEFGPYDRVQKNRRYNHGAICARARGGPDIHLRYDSDAAMVPGQLAHESSEGEIMDPKIAQALIAFLVDKQGMSRQDAEASVEDMAEENAKLKKDMEGMQAKLDMYEAKAKKDEDGEEETMTKADALAFAVAYSSEREQLKTVASRFDSVDAAAISDNAALRKAIVLAANPKARPEASPDYYAAAFDMIAPATRLDSTPRQTFRPSVVTEDDKGASRSDGMEMPNPEAEARAAMAQASKR